ncbi:MAG: imidazoleglycerol-phosphate dehydratase HisB [Desulfobacca sp.]|nr:imidazoleglycerol-phosphate dehydratase HisB [Desulfobacca sp.]
MIKQKARKALIKRETRETQIRLKLDLDGKGMSRIQSSVPFLNHMLELMTYHGSLDLDLTATGDIEVGFHHTVEDIGLCLGDAFNQCWGDLKGVNRYGEAILPMDEALVLVAVDISRRPHLSYGWKPQKVRVEGFDSALVKEFFQALVNRAGLTLHLKVLAGENIHHIIEAMFKGFGRAIRQASHLQENRSKVLSTKGIL